MEGKGVIAVILGVLTLDLVVAQIETKVSCKTDRGTNCFNFSLNKAKAGREYCLSNCACIDNVNSCPDIYPIPYNSMLETSGIINEYCKLGCASSVYDTITTNHNPYKGKVKEAVNLCKYACTELCNKGPILMHLLVLNKATARSYHVKAKSSSSI